MIGENSMGDEVRGRFVWRYSNSCARGQGGVPISVGDELGWSIWSAVTKQLVEFCPASGNETDIPVSASPTMDVTLEPTVREYDRFSLHCTHMS